MTQPTLFGAAEAPRSDRWSIVVGDAAEVFPTIRGAALVHADPPWSYTTAPLSGRYAADHYDTITMTQIVSHLAALYDCAGRDAYLACWCTWPRLGEWMAASAALPWAYVSGGAWAKSGRMGIGFHWRGDSEPLLLYKRGSPRALEAISNSHVSVRTEHSEKPIDFLRSIVRAFCPPDGLVVDLYAGRAPLGVACVQEGRRYVGVEIDPERAEIARFNIARAVHRLA